jgi:hypothetical protein
MASLIETLIDVLEQENTEYESLMETANVKTAAIVSGDVEKLQDILLEEQKFIDVITKLDAKREENVKDICNVLNVSARGVKITDIINMLEKQPKEQAALTEVHLKLKRTIDNLVRVNDNNKTLLQESMDMLDFEMNLARNAMVAPQTGNYSKGAYEQDTGYGTLGAFDAKQ